MKRSAAILIVCTGIVLIGAVLAFSAARAPQPARFVAATALVEPVQLVAAPLVVDPLPPAPVIFEAEVEDVSSPPRALNFLERRRHRLTIRHLMPLVREVIEEGEVDPDDTTAMAAAVLAKHIQDTPSLQDDPNMDWDSLLEFIERILPLILQIFALQIFALFS